ncbi:MAG: hypothetical protein R3185_07310, partial [Candidatus Thermoplasmatota archaeon]|nr:hypothetical protein [Candidatus Thermoplasmatota archaeon]
MHARLATLLLLLAPALLAGCIGDADPGETLEENQAPRLDTPAWPKPLPEEITGLERLTQGG